MKRLAATWLIAAHFVSASAQQNTAARQAATPPTATQVLTIGKSSAPSPITRIGEAVVAEAFRRAGLSVRFKPMPLRRTVEAANDGETDGDLERIIDVVPLYPNLVAVPTSINRIDMAVYGMSPGFAAKSRADIAKLKLGYTFGVFALRKHSQGMEAVEALHTSFDLLASGRIEVALVDYLDGESLLARYPDIVRWPHLWACELLYLMLNRKHLALVPTLNAALQQMKREGLIEKIHADELGRLGLKPLPDDRPAVATGKAPR